MAIAENFISSGRYFINLPISNFHHVNHEILRLNIQWNIRTKKFPLSRGETRNDEMSNRSTVDQSNCTGSLRNRSEATDNAARRNVKTPK